MPPREPKIWWRSSPYCCEFAGAGVEDVVVVFLFVGSFGEGSGVYLGGDVDMEALAAQLARLHLFPVAGETFVALVAAPVVFGETLGILVVGEEFFLVV